MKRIAILIALCPLFIFSQEETNEKSVSEVTATYCNENGRKIINYIPECDSLTLNMENYEVISFTFTRLVDEKLFTIKNTGNKMSAISKKLMEGSKQGTVYFENIIAVNKETNQEVSIPAISLKYDTN